MVNFVVVDDNSLYVSKIEKLVVTYMMNNKIDFHIEVFNDYTADLLKYIKKNKKNGIKHTRNTVILFGKFIFHVPLFRFIFNYFFHK